MVVANKKIPRQPDSSIVPSFIWKTVTFLLKIIKIADSWVLCESNKQQFFKGFLILSLQWTSTSCSWRRRRSDPFKDPCSDCWSEFDLLWFFLSYGELKASCGAPACRCGSCEASLHRQQQTGEHHSPAELHQLISEQFCREVPFGGEGRLRSDGPHAHSCHLIGSARHLLQRHGGLVGHVEGQGSDKAVSSPLRRKDVCR